MKKKKKKIRWSKLIEDISCHKLRVRHIIDPIYKTGYIYGRISLFSDGIFIGEVEFEEASHTVSGNLIFCTHSHLNKNYRNNGWGLLCYLTAIELITNKFPGAYINSHKAVLGYGTSRKARKVWNIISSSDVVKKRNIIKYSGKRIKGFRYNGPPILGNIIKRYRKRN